jgi:hypothetical protein
MQVLGGHELKKRRRGRSVFLGGILGNNQIISKQPDGKRADRVLAKRASYALTQVVPTK